MAYSVISYETDYIAGNITGGASTTSVTVPSDCTCMVVIHGGYNSDSAELGPDCTLGATTIPKIVGANLWQYNTCSILVLMSPATGAGTITWDDDEGGGNLTENSFIIIYLKGVDTAQAAFKSGSDTGQSATQDSVTTSDETDSIVIFGAATWNNQISSVIDTEIVIVNQASTDGTDLSASYQTGSGGADTGGHNYGASSQFAAASVEIDAGGTPKEAAGSTQNVAVTATQGAGALQTEKEAAGSTQEVAVTATQGAGALGTEHEAAGSTQEVPVTATQGTATLDGQDLEADGSTQEVAVTATQGTGTLGTELEGDGSTQEVAVTVTQGAGALQAEQEGDGATFEVLVGVNQGDAENAVPGGGGNWSISKGLHAEDGLI